jgi:hypothetical protein
MLPDPPPIPFAPRETGRRGAGRGALPGTASSARRRSETPPSRGSIEKPRASRVSVFPGGPPAPHLGDRLPHRREVVDSTRGGARHSAPCLSPA